MRVGEAARRFAGPDEMGAGDAALPRPGGRACAEAGEAGDPARILRAVEYAAVRGGSEGGGGGEHDGMPADLIWKGEGGVLGEAIGRFRRSRAGRPVTTAAVHVAAMLVTREPDATARRRHLRTAERQTGPKGWSRRL